MAKILELLSEFNESDWEAIQKYLIEWGNSKYCSGDLPEFAVAFATCYNVPIAIAAIKSAEETRKLNKMLLWLTVVLAILTFIIAIPIIRGVWEALLHLLQV